MPINSRCQDKYRITYNAYVAQGRTAADSATAAEQALKACLDRAEPVTQVAQPTVDVPSGRLDDTGPSPNVPAEQDRRSSRPSGLAKPSSGFTSKRGKLY